MSRIFQAGGPPIKNHPTYIERQADIDALDAALNGEYLHVSAPRQEGKTSLFNRLAAKLGEKGWRCAYVDLSVFMRFRQTAWYARLGRELAKGLTPNLSPALSNQVDLRNYLLDDALPSAGGEPKMALFFDEVECASKARDADGQPFSDSFFMTLRNLYNQRDDYEGTIVVALAGSVNPESLIKDPDISPFNIGEEIALNDFTPAETLALTGHLADLALPVDEAVHQTIYEWTNGHPYLTQRICAELEKRAGSEFKVITPNEVSKVIEQVILNQLKLDKNIRHVAKRLNNLSAPAGRLWSRLQATHAISLEKDYDLYFELALTGAIKKQDKSLVIRNRIYEEAFFDAAVRPAIPARPQTLSGSTTGMVIDKAIRLFISSTWKDLQPERKAVEQALNRMKSTTFVGMEYTASRPEMPKEVSLAEVERSDVYIGIFAHWYGEGITESEYRHAKEQGTPCLIYFKDENVPIIPAHIERDPSKSAKLDALKNELKAQHTVSLFTSPDSLARQVAYDLHNRFYNISTSAENVKSRYTINITHSQGIAIGDRARMTQTIP